jgi:signal peptidase I
MRKHVWRILSAQRDLLPAPAIESVNRALASMEKAVAARFDRQALANEMANLEKVATKWLKPYPHAAWRENIEVLLVAIAVAMGIRTFFLQPFKIPTGSMQPTLYGITSTPDFSRSGAFQSDLAPEPDFEIPSFFERFYKYWIHGIGYTHVKARADGALRAATEPTKFLLFNLKQTFYLGDDPKPYTVWFPPENLLKRAGLLSHFGQPNPKVFRKGEEVIKLKSISGDHLFVDRLTYNFRRPRRGEIIVFETSGIDSLPQDQYYIKRLVALGGEEVRIGNDRHLRINGKRLDASTPHFAGVYSFDPTSPPMESTYSGHVNELVARQCNLGDLARYFSDENSKWIVKPNHYMVMGDNTVNSLDSRSWGDFPRENVIGKSFFVYWPIGSQDGRGSRFGWGTQ